MTTATKKKREVKALVDRFGSNRMNAERPGELLRGCTCVHVPFAGGMCEIPFFDHEKRRVNILNVNDLDRHVINLAKVVRDRREELQRKLDGTSFDGDTLAESQAYCKSIDQEPTPDFGGTLDLHSDGQTWSAPDPFDWAFHYFICSWMTRGGKGGAKGEFDAGLSVRWKSGGGDSVVRFRSATEALTEWEKVMKRCTFHTLDCFEFLYQCMGKNCERDLPETGIYCDPPWPEDGDSYKHSFAEPMQRRLAKVLAGFEKTRVVVRYGDHPLIRELYPESHWTWNLLESRTQANKEKAEVLLTNWRPA